MLSCATSLLTGCESDKVPIEAGAESARCAPFIKSLPNTLDSQLRRPVDPEDAMGAAWGDPAVVVRCGVGKPEGYDEFPACDRIEGVDWFVRESAATDQRVDAVLTTLGRQPAIEVTVPAARRPPTAALVELAPYIKAHTQPSAGGCH